MRTATVQQKVLQQPRQFVRTCEVAHVSTLPGTLATDAFGRNFSITIRPESVRSRSTPPMPPSPDLEEMWQWAMSGGSSVSKNDHQRNAGAPATGWRRSS